MKKSKKLPIFRAGDIVKIKNPEFFVRCGYPLTKEDIKREFLADKQKMDAFKDFLQKIELMPKNCNLLNFDNLISFDVFEILDRICYKLLKDRGFGGNERKIFTKLKPEFADKEFRVISKSVVNTGIRINGSSCRWGWDSEYEYNPPYLTNQKSHIILDIEEIFNDYNYHTKYILRIEEINVELVKEQ